MLTLSFGLVFVVPCLLPVLPVIAPAGVVIALFTGG